MKGSDLIRGSSTRGYGIVLLLFSLNWWVLLLLHPSPADILPLKDSDSLLYTFLMQKCALGKLQGDPLIWEHRTNPSSLFTVYHLWPWLLGQVYRFGGYVSLQVISVGLSMMWFIAAHQIGLRIGVPRRFALLIAGLQTFFLSNLVYQILGYRGNFTNYTLWVSEHEKLYASVVSVSFYHLAALSVLCTLNRRTPVRVLATCFLCSLTSYGRPFDWMVILVALGLYLLLSLIRKDLPRALTTFLILSGTLILSSYFIFTIGTYRSTFKSELFDQLIRGNLQVKNPSHYVKYALICLLLLGPLWLKWIRASFTGVSRKDEEVEPAPTWILILTTAGFLTYFQTVLDGGKTLVGFTYFAVFNGFPWLFLLYARALLRAPNLSRRLQRLPSWLPNAIFFVLLVIQSVGIGFRHLPKTPSDWQDERTERKASRLIHDTMRDPVILSLGNNLVMASLIGDAWLYYGRPVVVTYTTSAPTHELLERYLMVKLLLHGTIDDLEPFFSENGFEHVKTWEKKTTPAQRFWFEMLVQGIGHNTFIFHPQKNLGEIRVRKLNVPDPLLAGSDFFVYFDPELRETYHQVRTKYSTLDPDQRINAILERFKLDYIYIPEKLEAYTPAFPPKSDRIQPVPVGEHPLGLWRIVPPSIP